MQINNFPIATAPPLCKFSWATDPTGLVKSQLSGSDNQRIIILLRKVLEDVKNFVFVLFSILFN